MAIYPAALLDKFIQLLLALFFLSACSSHSPKVESAAKSRPPVRFVPESAWELPSAFKRRPDYAGEESAALLLFQDIGDDETYLAFHNHLVIVDQASHVLTKKVPFPDAVLQGVTIRVQDIGISPNGDFVMVNGYIWNRKTENWDSTLAEQFKGLASPVIVAGNRQVAVAAPWKGSVWLFPWAKPDQVLRWNAENIPFSQTATPMSVYLSPDENLFLKGIDGDYALIDTKSGNALEKWMRPNDEGEIVSWSNNRVVTMKSHGDSRGWTVYGIYPYAQIASGELNVRDVPIVSDSEGMAVFIDDRKGAVTVIDLISGDQLGRQILPGIIGSKAWFKVKESPLTLLFTGPSQKEGIAYRVVAMQDK